MVEINVDPGVSIEQAIPASYNGFAFVLEGSVQIGETVLNTGQVGWFDRTSDNGTSSFDLRIRLGRDKRKPDADKEALHHVEAHRSWVDKEMAQKECVGKKPHIVASSAAR